MNQPTCTVSICATAHALLAMEEEIACLQKEEERLMAKRRLVLEKMAACHTVIKQLFLNTGAKYELIKPAHFPALNGD